MSYKIANGVYQLSNGRNDDIDYYGDEMDAMLLDDGWVPVICENQEY